MAQLAVYAVSQGRKQGTGRAPSCYGDSRDEFGITLLLFVG